MSLRKILFVLVFAIAGELHAFTTSLINLVGIPVGSSSTIALPSVIKAGSGITPLFRIDISTDLAGYTLAAITCTLSNQVGFDASVDLLALGSGGLLLYKDSSNSIWEGSGTETSVPVTFSPSSWTGNSPEVIKLTLDSPTNINLNNTFYICMRTSSGLGDGDQFRAQLDNAGEVVIGLNGASDLQPTLAANGSIMTADTLAPAITAKYNPNASNGTTISVSNNAADNVYKVGDTISVFVYVTESGVAETGNNLRGDTSVVSLNDCVEISAGSIIGTLGSGTTVFTEVGAGVFWLQYTINNSTVNVGTDGTSPLTLGIKVKDGAGNESSIDSSFEIYLDSKTPSALTLLTPNDGEYANTKSPVFSWTASDEGHLQEYILSVATSSDFGGSQNNAHIGKSTTSVNIIANTAAFFGYDFSLGALVTGTTYYWVTVAGDKAGHYPSSMAGLTYGRFVWDEQGPQQAVFETPTPGQVLRGGGVAVKAYVGDYGRSGVDPDEITLKLNDGTNDVVLSPSSSYSSATGSYTVTYTPSAPLADGTYTLKLDAKDKLGNAMTQATQSFNVDSTSPTMVDTDNDGETDSTEKVMGSDWLDPSSVSGATSFSLTDGEVVNYKTLVTDSASTLTLMIEDVYGSGSASYASSPAIDASTVTVSGKAGTFIFGANNLPYAKTSLTNDTDTGGGTSPRHIYNRFTCQLPVALANDGSDDGTYTVDITAADDAGNIASFSRSFIYDTTHPTVSTVTAPSAISTAESFEFVIDASDGNGISGSGNAVMVYILNSSGGAEYSSPMAADPDIAGRYSYNGAADSASAGNYYYYFAVTDKAGNVAYYPAGANNDKSKAIALTVTDMSGPWVVIGNDSGGAGDSQNGEQDSYIETLAGVPVDGAFVTNYNYATNPAINEIPTVYSASDNILQATAQDETVGAEFQYKSSTETSWHSLTTYQTSTNQVWEAVWDTTGLSETTYDIRVKAWDVLGNTTTPKSVVSPGWVQVSLKAALGPQASIDTASNDVVVVEGQRIHKKAVLCASLAATGNLDFNSVKFQYRKSGGSWQDIETDSDPTSNTPKNVTFVFNYADLLKYRQAQDTAGSDVVLDTAAITAVTFGCSTDATYNRSMKFYGSSWTVKIPLVPATYDYVFYVGYADGSGDTLADIDQQDSAGATSRIIIAPFTAVWDVSSLSDGIYDIRAVAKDSRGVEDDDPAAISVVVDNSVPTSVQITAPSAADRLQTGAANALYADATDSSDMDNGYVFFMYSLDGGYIWTRIANEDTTEGVWTQNWTPSANYANDTNALIKAVAVDEAGNMSQSSPVSVVLDATNPKILSYSINESTASEISLNMGTVYTWSVTSTDSDIAKLAITIGGGIPSDNYSWNPSNEMTSYTGSGTTADPYKFSGTFMANIDETEDNQQVTLTATLTDNSGRTNAVVRKIDFKDVTPNPASIRSVDGFQVRSGDVVQTSGKFINVVCDLPIDDNGVDYYQYRRPGSTNTWKTWATDTTPSNGDTTIFPPDGITLTDGNYELRIFNIDDDNNADPSPAVVTINVDTSKPDVKPASIISCTTGGTLTAVEYDELVSQVQFEYRLQGTSNWEWLGVDTIVDSTFGSAGNTWSRPLPATLAAGTYDVRAISQYAGGPGEASPEITPVAAVVIKRDAANNRLIALNPQKTVSMGVSNISFDQGYAGVENTMKGTLSIISSQTLSNVTARLLMKGGGTTIDRYLNVSGSGGLWSASLDLSELFGGGNGMVVMQGKDASGNIVSASEPFAVVASATNPNLGGGGIGRVTAATFGAALENNSALAVVPSSTPALASSQSSLITTVGEPWDFLLSDPDAFDVSNTCTITMSYTDAEVSGLDETKLGAAYWDESTGKWSAEGITAVTRDIVNNTITFTTSHFSRFGLAVINSAPAVTFISPDSSGYAGSDPIIEANLADSFSGIRSAKVEVDGANQTAWLAAIAYRDGIDNDGNGLIDEDPINAGGVSETPLNQVSATAAKYKVKAPLHLSDGSHTIKITATNAEGVSASASATFTVGSGMAIKSAFCAPNPFDPASENARIKVNMTGNAYVTLKVYDFSGRLVYKYTTPTEVGSGALIPWNGRDDNNKLLANGVYFVRVEASGGGGKAAKTIKAALLR